MAEKKHVRRKLNGRNYLCLNTIKKKERDKRYNEK